jgi:hypothetical protein
MHSIQPESQPPLFALDCTSASWHGSIDRPDVFEKHFADFEPFLGSVEHVDITFVGLWSKCTQKFDLFPLNSKNLSKDSSSGKIKGGHASSVQSLGASCRGWKPLCMNNTAEHEAGAMFVNLTETGTRCLDPSALSYII